MTEKNIFEAAAQAKLRFPFRGQCTTEDLYDLNMKQLDALYQTLRTEQEADRGVDSLIENPKTSDSDVGLKIAIVKHIFEQKRLQAAALVDSRERAEKRRRIAELLEQKKNEALAGKSLEELEALLVSI